ALLWAHENWKSACVLREPIQQCVFAAATDDVYASDRPSGNPDQVGQYGGIAYRQTMEYKIGHFRCTKRLAGNCRLLPTRELPIDPFQHLPRQEKFGIIKINQYFRTRQRRCFLNQ